MLISQRRSAAAATSEAESTREFVIPQRLELTRRTSRFAAGTRAPLRGRVRLLAVVLVSGRSIRRMLNSRSSTVRRIQFDPTLISAIFRSTDRFDLKRSVAETGAAVTTPEDVCAPPPTLVTSSGRTDRYELSRQRAQNCRSDCLWPVSRGPPCQ
jgi:hypothetical protein